MLARLVRTRNEEQGLDAAPFHLDDSQAAALDIDVIVEHGNSIQAAEDKATDRLEALLFVLGGLEGELLARVSK